MDKTRLRELGPRQSERLRLLVFGVLLVLVLGLFLFTKSRTTESSAPAPADDYRPMSTEFAPPASKVNPALLTEIRDSTEAERVLREQVAFVHLMTEVGKAVPGDFRRMDAEPMTSELTAKILERPEDYRGDPFIIKARYLFSRVERIKLDMAPGEGLPIYEGLVQDDTGNSYSFTSLESPEDFETGQVVRLSGFFMKKKALFDPQGELIDPTLHFVTKRLVHSFLRMPDVTNVDLTLMSTVRDYELEDQLAMRDDILYHLISNVQNTDEITIGTEAEDVTYAHLLRDPEEYRGKPVRVLGTFHKAWKQSLGPGGENPLDLDEVWHGLLVHFGPSFTYTIALEPPPDWVKEPGTHAIAEGIFYKSYAYQARNRKTVNCPLLIVKRFVPYRVDASNVDKTIAFGVIGLGVLFLLWVSISTLSDKSANREFKKRYYERRKRRVAEAMEDGAGSGLLRKKDSGAPDGSS